MAQCHSDAADVRAVVVGLRLRYPTHVDSQCGRPEADGVSHPTVHGYGLEPEGVYPAERHRPHPQFLLLKYLDSPSEYMAHFLKTHPDFIAGELAKGGKAAERAKLAIEKGYANA